MSLLGSTISDEVGLQLLLRPFRSSVVIRTACCSVGIVLPVYNTFKAIEKKDPNEQQKWLLYWAAYGSFSLVEVFSDKLISWFPLYYHMKFAFLVWLQLPFPSADGARHLYMRHIRPFFLRHEATLDQLVGCAHREMAVFLTTYQAQIQFVKSLLGRVVSSVSDMMRNDSRSSQSPGQNAIEGAPESDHDD